LRRYFVIASRRSRSLLGSSTGGSQLFHAKLERDGDPRATGFHFKELGQDVPRFARILPSGRAAGAKIPLNSVRVRPAGGACSRPWEARCRAGADRRFGAWPAIIPQHGYPVQLPEWA
jgi:hypothetical protein